MTCYSVQPRDRIFVKGYGFLSFAKNMLLSFARNVIRKYSQKLIDHATDAFKITSQRAIQKTADPTDNLIGNKIDGKNFTTK